MEVKSSVTSIILLQIIRVLAEEDADFRLIPTFCEGDYSGGSLDKPCTFCRICQYKRDDTGKYLQPTCITNQNTRPLVFGLSGYCAKLNFCQQGPSWTKCPSGTCENLYGIRKCNCDQTRYGTKCEKTIPPELSTESFADLQNIVYLPYVYSTDFATFYLYFFSTGKHFNVEVSSGREKLTYNTDACSNNVMDISEYCDHILKPLGIKYLTDICVTHPMYENNRGKTRSTCAIKVNLLFPRLQRKPYNRGDYVMDTSPYNVSNERIVAKKERVVITVKNKIPLLGTENVVFDSYYDFTVVYIGKSLAEKCSPLVKIPGIRSSMKSITRFPRSKDISISSYVVQDEALRCDTFGPPKKEWMAWIITYNHDEKSDQPFITKHHEQTLDFPPYSLAYGVYKVKLEVQLETNYFSKETTYCYFEIVHIPLISIVLGGDLRYVYYKDNLELIARHGADPNFPLNDQPRDQHRWFCTATGDSLCVEEVTEDDTFIKPGPFAPGKIYNFTLLIVSPNSPPVDAYQTIIISENKIPSLLIECFKNCGGRHFKSDTREIIYFVVKQSPYSPDWPTEQGPYQWTYSEKGGPVLSVEDIIQQEKTPDWVLIVERNSLAPNKEYEFKVTGGGDIPGEAKIFIRTLDAASDLLSCEIIPKLGIKGETKFVMDCSLKQYDDNMLSSTFTFYDKNVNNASGRFLCSSSIGAAENLILTRGTVIVRVTNEFGLFIETSVTATLTAPIIERDFLKTRLALLPTFSESSGYSQKISFLSALGDILNSVPLMKKEAVGMFLEVLNNEQPSTLLEIELLLTTTQSIICNEDDCSEMLLDKKSYSYLLQILIALAKALSEELVSSAGINSYVTSDTVNFLFHSLWKCAGVLLSVQDQSFINSTISTVDYNVYKLYKYGSLKMVDILNTVDKAIAINGLPFLKSKFVDTEFTLTWMKEDDPYNFITGSGDGREESFVKISPELAQYLKNTSRFVVLQTTGFKNDPYWWSQVEHVNTEMISASIGYVDRTENASSYENYKAITYFDGHSVDAFVKKKDVKNQTVSGTVTQVVIENDPDQKDMAIATHTIFPPKGAILSITFINLDEEDVFRVLITHNLRPDYELMDLEAVTVNRSSPSPSYNVSNSVEDGDDLSILFIGILPGKSVIPGTNLNYTFELQTIRCQIWYELLWTTAYCKVGNASSEKYLHCQCTHLSSIAGFFKVPMNTVNPFEDYKLLLDIPNNPFVFALTLTLFFIFIILLIWSIKTDKKDMHKTNLIVLEDNISTDEFGYIVIMCTGARMCGGTSSKIGIRLHGSEASSRSHILRSSRRLTLQRNDDDWFLIFTPYHLGTITSIQLWTSHSGPAPNWFCDRVYIHDLHLNQDYTFIIGKWFGVTLVDLRLESFARPVQLDQETYFTWYFTTNAVNAFRETHLYLSIVACHPRGPMARPQRLSLAMVAIFVTLLTSIMFFTDASPAEDPPMFTISRIEVLISIYSMIIASVVVGTVFLAFRVSYVLKKVTKKKRSREQSWQRVNVDNVKLLTGSKAVKRGLFGFLKYYIRKFVLSFRNNDYFPVKTMEVSYYTRYKKREMFAWVYCFTVVFATCYFMILYGLKIGKVKSLLWLSATFMSFSNDAFVVDPVKIMIISLIYGLLQAEVCDLYSYDQAILELKRGNTRDLDLDRSHHEKRFNNEYKHLSKQKEALLQNLKIKILKWWTLIDAVDICTSVIIIFIITSQINLDYINNEMIKNVLLKDLPFEGSYAHFSVVKNKDSYWRLLQYEVLPHLYTTHWYNKWSMTAETEEHPETGWTADSTHRLLGVPRLRQIRVLNESCVIPRVLKSLSMVHCKVKYSTATEDTVSHGTRWKGSDYDDIMFSKSPWIYHPEHWTTSLSVLGESTKRYHGGGYIAELKSTQRVSSDTMSSLTDANWLDFLTRVAFFEAPAYNVNVRAFSVIIVITEFLESSLVLAGKRVISVFIKQENVLWEIAYILYAILALTKLGMLLNTVGGRVFFKSFWFVYDLVLIVVGATSLVLYRLYLQLISYLIEKFLENSEDVFFPFYQLSDQIGHLKNTVALVLILTTARSLRLLKYLNLEVWQKQRKSLYFTWPKILWLTLVFVLLMSSLQRLILRSAFVLYPTQISHYIPYKFNYHHLRHRAAHPEPTFFPFIPSFMYLPASAAFVVVLVRGYITSYADL